MAKKFADKCIGCGQDFMSRTTYVHLCDRCLTKKLKAEGYYEEDEEEDDD